MKKLFEEARQLEGYNDPVPTKDEQLVLDYIEDLGITEDSFFYKGNLFVDPRSAISEVRMALESFDKAPINFRISAARDLWSVG